MMNSAIGVGRALALCLLVVFQPAFALDTDREEGRAFIDDLQTRLAGLPGVESVGLTDNLNLNTMNTQSSRFNVDGFDPPAGVEYFSADRATVDGGYFEAAGVRIVSGRAFDSSDTPEGDRVAIISQAFADRFWPDGDAVGRTFRSQSGNEVRIVGVASNTKVRSIGETPRFFVYYPFARDYGSYNTILARGSGDE